MPFSARVIACHVGPERQGADGTVHATSVVRLDQYLPMREEGTGLVRAGDGGNNVRAVKTEKVNPDFYGWVDEVRLIAVEPLERLPTLKIVEGTPVYLDV
jgi:hypothetical protein